MEFFKNRREALAENLENGDMIIVFGAEQPAGISRFIQDNNFLYLTGLEIPFAKLVIYKYKDKTTEVLFIEENIPERIVWDGEKMYPKEATEISGIENIKFISSFKSYITSLMPMMELIYVNYGTPSFDKPLNTAHLFTNELKNYFPHILVEEFTDLITPLRSVKDKLEIENLQKAIDVTAEGIMEIYKTAKAGMMEYQLEALLQYKMLYNGVRNYGFTPIIACGKNATTLHYISNDTKIQNNQLVLLDVGAAYNNYSADISRTFPIEAKFTERQKQVYEKVLNIQKEIISMVKPGVGMKDLNEKTNELIGEALIDLGLISDKSDFRKYYMHSIGHHLGLDTHDLGARDSVLEEGNVITVEPGIYIPEEGIGVRIEDDILVTKNGHINLSANIPKEVEELEAIRAKALQ